MGAAIKGVGARTSSHVPWSQGVHIIENRHLCVYLPFKKRYNTIYTKHIR